MYWIGRTYSLLNILRRLIELHSTSGAGYTINVINHDNVKSYVPDLPECFYSLLPAHQADFVRVSVLCERGGIWMDADTIVMGSLDPLFDILKTKDGFFVKENNLALWNGVFGTRPNTPLMRVWRNRIRNTLDIKGAGIGWTDIGHSCLAYIFDNAPQYYTNYTIFNGLDTMYPVNWTECVNDFLKKPYENYKTLVRDFQPFVVLVNSVYKSLEHASEQQILDAKMPLNYFINKSIENKGIQYNKLYNNNIIYNYGSKDYISNSIINHKSWEPTITNVFNNIIKHKPDNIIIDVGCNMGYYSIISSNRCKHIYSFDGNSTNISMLSMSVAHNNITNIEPIYNIVADTETNYKMKNKAEIDYNGNIGGLSFEKNDNAVIGVTSITLDKFIHSHSVNFVDILKVDVEGGELDVLKGCMESLKSNIIKNVIIEISPKYNTDGYDILSILQSAHYDLYNIPLVETGDYTYSEQEFSKLTHANNQIKDITAFLKTVPHQTNVLAIKQQGPKKFVIIADYIETFLMQEPYVNAKYLETYGWEIIKQCNVKPDEIKRQKCVVLCATYDRYDISSLKCDNVTLIYNLHDVYPFKNIRNYCIDDCNIIIGPYQYLFSSLSHMYKNITKKTSYWIPNSAVNDFFEDIAFNTSPKDTKIFVSGDITSEYPMRALVINDERFKDIVDRLKHPSYDAKHTGATPINKNYYKQLNEYLCCFTDALTYKYTLYKVFEITAVGSLLLVEDSIKEQLSKLGFIDMETCVLCNASNVYEKMMWIIDKANRPQVDAIRRRGMELTRSKHTTRDRAAAINALCDTIINPNHESLERKAIFQTIYEKNVWNNGDAHIPLSGPGSSIENTKDVSNLLTKFIYENKCSSVLDLGCGDLTWMSKTQFFNDDAISYTGIDIAELLIQKHSIAYPKNRFFNKDIVCSNDIEHSSLIIIRDVIFHLSIQDVQSIFRNIRGKFDYIAITSCNNTKNVDDFNQWHFNERNLHIEPFSISKTYITFCDEPVFRRQFYIYSHNEFYKSK